MGYPEVRPRRLRRTPTLRRMVRETRLTMDSLIYPVFVQEGARGRSEIRSMPGQYRWPLQELPGLARDIESRGIPGMMLFGLPQQKDELGTEAYNPDGIVQRAIRVTKDAVPELVVIADTCLDEYTSHGHCGVVVDGDVDNDATLELLARTGVSQAEAGADMVAPSDMMDGRVGVIRRALDTAGLENIPIMSYAVKYASAFYGPFRDAADSAPLFGDRRSYQMDSANTREALRELSLDLEEGADVVMVKPAMPYLDIISRVRAATNIPLAAYNVSGEYAMVKAAVQQGWLEERAIVLETLTSIARAGADMILTYHACEAAGWLEERG